MRNLYILVALLFTVSIASAQYGHNKWAIEAEVGAHSLQDYASESLGGILTNDGVHFGLAGRYNFNPKFGLGIVAGYDKLTLESQLQNNLINSDYYRLNLQAYVNIFKVLDLNPKRLTMLVHGGPGLSWINNDNGYSERIENLSGGVTALYKLSNRVALKLDFTSTGNINGSRTFDGLEVAQSAGISSTVHNLSVGVVYYLGRKAHKLKLGEPELEVLDHLDWVYEPREEIYITNEYITQNYPKEFITNTIQLESSCDCEYITNEYVFFDHDEDVIRDTELNAIYKIYEQLRLNDSIKLVIDGWASPTSSSDEYNLDLSKRRSQAVYDKLIAMGVSEDRILAKTFNGKDNDKNDSIAHDVARRVELILVMEN